METQWAPARRLGNITRGIAARPPLEDALRFGYAARLRYAAEYPMWGDALESRLRLDWEAMFPDRRDEWKSDVEAMRFAWHHDPEN